MAGKASDEIAASDAFPAINSDKIAATFQRKIPCG